MKNIFKKSGTIKDLKTQIVSMQNDIDILAASIETKKNYTGNPYPNYYPAIIELSNKYEGIADWGIQQARNIIDIRAAFTIGQGIKVSLKDDKKSKKNELDFINDFIEFNDLDEEMPQEFAKETEIEGRFLGKLFSDKEAKQIKLRFVSYTTNTYKIKTNPNDYMDYEKAIYTDSKTSREVVLKDNEFVYSKFCGRLDKVNDIKPKIAMVLSNIESIDKALYDFRKINYLLTPTPYFKCGNVNEATSLNKALRDANWKLGNFLCTTSDFDIKGIPTENIDSLEKEIVTNSKIISGATGIPVHFLGLPELMSNRAVSTDLFELIIASTNKERHIWIGTYEEIFKKAMAMSNEKFQTNFDIDSINVEIPYVTESKIKALTETWLPLYMSGAIDLDYMLSLIPNIDAEKIKRGQQEDLSLKLNALKNAGDDGNNGDTNE